MINTLKVDYTNRTLVMDRTFSKNAKIVGSKEYNLLQQAKRDYPELTVVTRQIKKNVNKECYKGLTYDYMHDYIITHEPIETRTAVVKELEEMILISKCHSKAYRYPVIKEWFLNKYTEIKNFGMPTLNTETGAQVLSIAS